VQKIPMRVSPTGDLLCRVTVTVCHRLPYVSGDCPHGVEAPTVPRRGAPPQSEPPQGNTASQRVGSRTLGMQRVWPHCEKTGDGN
jgi:hypothetical protein